jgi:glycosyltransferase involved in cell wall biosynthesis/multidrug resistance efflux pump
MPKVSVVMCVYNHEKFVSESIESVINQTYQDWEFIITNDGSTDQTLDIIKQYDDPRITLFSFDKNTGARVARNNSIKHAKGEYIAVINSDDVWLLNKLEKQVNFLDTNPDIGAVFTYASFINDQSEDIGYEHHYGKIFIQHNRNRFEWLRDFFVGGNCLCHPSVLIRKICHEDLGLYDERLGQLADFDMWIRLVTKYQIHILVENLVKFRLLKDQGNISGNTPKNNSRLILEWSQILKNYLQPEILDNLHQIFNLKTNINEVGLSLKIQPICRDIAPFFVAMLASKSQHPGHQYFCFDVLYQMLANQELAQKLREQYYFDFSNLTNLAREQDIFGIVALDRVQSQLHETEALLQQSQSELYQIQALWEQSHSQMHHTQQELEQSKAQLHQTQGELHQTQVEFKRSQSQLHQTQGELEHSQTQLHQIQGELENSQTQLHQTQGELAYSKTQLHQTQGELHQTQGELHQTQVEFKRSQSQLHQTQGELENSQTQLHQTQTELQNSQTQLHQTQTELENSQTQLHQTQTELKRSQSQLDQTQEELEQSYSQVYQSQRELEQSQIQLHQTEALLEQSQIQLHQTEALLEQSQTQLHQKQEEWNRLQTQLHQIQEKLEQSQTQQHQIEAKVQQFQMQLHQTQEQLQQSQTQLHQTQEQLQQSEIQLHQTQGELELSQFQQALGNDKDGQDQMQYRLLVWEACRAYHNNALTKMQECLQQSLKYTPFSGTQTVNDWLESLAKFSSEKGCKFDTYSLTNSEEWKQLMGRAVRVKPILGRSRFVGQA